MKLPLMLLLGLALFGADLSAQPRTLEQLAQLVNDRYQTRPTPAAVVPAFVPTEPVSATMPTNVHSSIDPTDLLRVPLVLKADRWAIGMLKWTPPLTSPDDPVVGYETQPVGVYPNGMIRAVTQPEMPFNVGMIEVVAGEYWQVRAVFASGRRSSWAISRTYPERVTQQYQ